MNRKRSAFWAAAGTTIGLVVLAALAPRETPPVENGDVPESEAAVARLPELRASGQSDPVDEATAEAIATRLPNSLEGTESDGALVVDASGAFVVTPDAIDLFDYYLSAFGEEPIERIVARIEAAIRARVDPPDEALALLDRYLAYRDEVQRMVEVEGLEALPLERRLQLLRETRRSIFGAEVADALFAEDEARDRNAIAWQRVADDPTLDPQERADRLAALEAERPEAERERWARVTVAERTIARESAMREQGASQAEIHAQREEEFGVDAAARLAELDRSREAWAARVADYRHELATLETSASSDPAETTAEIEALRARLFEGPELVRIRALDEAEARATGAP